MTVSPGTDGKLLFTFVAGITTDVGAVNANGLRARSDRLVEGDDCDAAGAHRSLDGSVTGSVTGDGTLNGDGSADVTLHFLPESAERPAGLSDSAAPRHNARDYGTSTVPTAPGSRDRARRTSPATM